MASENLKPQEKVEIKYISGDVKDKNDLEVIFKRACELFGQKEDDARELCSSHSEITPSSIVRLAELLDSKVEVDYMTGKIKFCYNALILTNKHIESKEKTATVSVFEKKDDSDDFPF